MKDRAPDMPKDEMDPEAGLDACASDLIDAIYSKDIKRVSQVLRDSFELLESQPHEEYEAPEEEKEQI